MSRCATSFAAAMAETKRLCEADRLPQGLRITTHIADVRINAPHIKCSVVMPGQIGTSIRSNSRKIHSGTESDVMDATQIAQARARITSMGTDVSSLSDEDIQKMVAESERRFREEAPMTATEAATVILDGVKAGPWRILVGEDAQRIDDLVRRSPERAYDVDFF